MTFEPEHWTPLGIPFTTFTFLAVLGVCLAVDMSVRWLTDSALAGTLAAGLVLIAGVTAGLAPLWALPAFVATGFLLWAISLYRAPSEDDNAQPS